jgi:hypothetical protein
MDGWWSHCDRCIPTRTGCVVVVRDYGGYGRSTGLSSFSQLPLACCTWPMMRARLHCLHPRNRGRIEELEEAAQARALACLLSPSEIKRKADCRTNCHHPCPTPAPTQSARTPAILFIPADTISSLARISHITLLARYRRLGGH